MVNEDLTFLDAGPRKRRLSILAPTSRLAIVIAPSPQVPYLESIDEIVNFRLQRLRGTGNIQYMDYIFRI
jgi:hypothetical protein